MASKSTPSSSSSKKTINNMLPAEKWSVTNVRHTGKPHLMAECTVLGLSENNFDEHWDPKPSNVMWIGSMTLLRVMRGSPQTLDIPSKTGDSGVSKTNSDATEISNSLSNLNTDASSSSSSDAEATSKSVQNECLTSSADIPDGRTEKEKEEQYQCFLDWNRIEEQFFTFVSHLQHTLSPALYDATLSKWPLEFRLKLGFVGACSITLIVEFYARGEGGDKVFLWSSDCQVVVVDKKTRQPARLPARFIKKYQGCGCLKQGMALRPFKRPSITYCHTISVQWSDTDHVGHANWSSYIKWASEALITALMSDGDTSSTNTTTAPGRTDNKGKDNMATTARSQQQRAQALGDITREVVARGLAQFEVSYYRECLEGDRVEIHLWQDKKVEDPALVWCCLVKKREDIAQIKLWYFSDKQ